MNELTDKQINTNERLARALKEQEENPEDDLAYIRGLGF